MHILALDAYHGGSHCAFISGWIANSRHQFDLLTLPAYKWKWRMRHAAVHTATQIEKLRSTDNHWDIIFCSDMLNLAELKGLEPQLFSQAIAVLYFHENQLTYPWSEKDRDIQAGRDNHYGFINYVSALAADFVFFNSEYHRDSFLGALPNFLKGFPDYNELETVERIEKHSQVLNLGLDLLAFDAFAVSREPAVPVLLWNHRWEYDKNPKDFFEALCTLQGDNIDFKLIVMGENFSRQPEEFEEARVRLADKLLHFGYAESFEEYAQWPQRADIIPVTSYQDFFGGSIVQAMYCGVIPLLPNRLAYPQHIPNNLHDKLLYGDNSELVPKLKALIAESSQMDRDVLKAHVAGYDWSRMAVEYDQVLASSRLPK